MLFKSIFVLLGLGIEIVGILTVRENETEIATGSTVIGNVNVRKTETANVIGTEISIEIGSMIETDYVIVIMIVQTWIVEIAIEIETETGIVIVTEIMTVLRV